MNKTEFIKQQFKNQYTRPGRVKIDWKESSDGCWLWVGKLEKNGYAKVSNPYKRGSLWAHRFIYQMTKGKIIDGLVLDHLCRNKRCVNPDHLEVVTQKENVMRGTGITAMNHKKTHCIRGHELKGSNLSKAHLKHGRRWCLKCKRIRRTGKDAQP